MPTKTIAVSPKEYRVLREKSIRYDELREFMKHDLFSSPPTRDSEEVVRAFRDTKRYGKEFLKDLKNALKRSSHFTQ